MIDNKPDVYYERTYSDDVGKKTNDIFSKNPPEFLAYRKMWSGVIDGFMNCSNTDLTFFCTDGNIRIVISNKNEDGSFSFGQYFMSELDGKVITIEKNTDFAIQNIDNDKSAYILGYFVEDPQFRYYSKNNFDWRRKMA